MSANARDRNLVVIELAGGNDALNTVIPYSDGLYYDYRSGVGIPQEQVLKIDRDLGLNPNLAPLMDLWNEGNMAIVNGIGYANPSRSHFRARDIWYTAEPEQVVPEGWLAGAIRDLDPAAENVLTGVNFGRGLPRALVGKGVPVASVGSLETYGLLPDVVDQVVRERSLEAFRRMYGPDGGKDVLAQALSQSGSDALKGADILRTAPGLYKSSVEYADTPIAQSLRGVAQVMFADLGTRVYYAQHGSFDTHAGQNDSHAKLWTDTSNALGDFMDDVKEHGLEDEVLVLVFSEFGRRIQDNTAGTDHGSGGVSFVIGGPVNGGFYGEYPSLKEEDHLEGDLHFNTDFRSIYSTIAERWLGVDPELSANGRYEQIDFIASANGS